MLFYEKQKVFVFFANLLPKREFDIQLPEEGL